MRQQTPNDNSGCFLLVAIAVLFLLGCIVRQLAMIVDILVLLV